LSVLVLLAACESAAAPDAPDVPLDVPRDVPLDVRPDAGPAVLELGPGSADAWPDWTVLDEVTPRGLPADARPRLLWVWTPSLDPGIPDREAPGLTPQAVSRSPSGRLFVRLRGGGLSRLAWLSPGGELLGTSWSLGTGVPSRPIALPDGGVGIAVNEGELASFGVLQEDGSFALFNGGPIQAVGSDSRLTAAVGAHGMVYVLGPRWLAAACHGTERVWMLRFPTNVYELAIDEAGEPWVRSWLGWARVSRRGELGAWGVGERCADAVGDTIFCNEFIDGETVFTARRGGMPAWSYRIPTMYWSGLWDAEGRLWLEDDSMIRDGRRALRRVGPDGVEFDVAGQILGVPWFAPLADGSLFGENSFASTDIGLRDPGTGEIRWSLEVPDPTSTGVITGVREMPAVGPDGVAYFVGGISVYAYQLDRLPPEEPYCLGAYCGNSRLDGAPRRFSN
jgi:hypothetical protein